MWGVSQTTWPQTLFPALVWADWELCLVCRLPPPGIYRCPLPPGPGPVPPWICQSPALTWPQSTCSPCCSSARPLSPSRRSPGGAARTCPHTSRNPASCPWKGGTAGRAQIKWALRRPRPGGRWSAPRMASQCGLCYPQKAQVIKALCAQRVSGAVMGGCECPPKRGDLVVLCPSGSHRGGHWTLLALQSLSAEWGRHDNAPSSLCLSHLGLSAYAPSCVSSTFSG